MVLRHSDILELNLLPFKSLSVLMVLERAIYLMPCSFYHDWHLTTTFYLPFKVCVVKQMSYSQLKVVFLSLIKCVSL